MKEYKQLGAYGIVIEDDKILLIKKAKGPYEGKLDLPGGTIEFGEKPETSLKREMTEEAGIEIVDYDLFAADSVSFDWKFKEDVIVKVHHVGIFYYINKYKNEIKKELDINEVNDDSLGAEFYEISKLKREELSEIAILILEKLGNL